jgi:glycine/D-amino acid oxidase-like deaminating enzyme
MIAPEEAAALVPELAADRFVGRLLQPDDGIVFPWPFLWGYAHAAAKRGRRDPHVDAGHRDRAPRGRRRLPHHDAGGTFTAERIVCAAGAWSPEVARLVGASLPNRPSATRSCRPSRCKPFLKPMVTVSETGLYVSQSLRGELVGGISMPAEDDGGEVRLGSRLAFTTTMARALVELMPRSATSRSCASGPGPTTSARRRSDRRRAARRAGLPRRVRLPRPRLHDGAGRRAPLRRVLSGGRRTNSCPPGAPPAFTAGTPPRAGGGEEMFIGNF